MSDITADNSRIKMHVTRSLIPLVLVVGIGIVISIAAFFSLQQSERNARESAFERVAHDRAATLQSKIQNTFSVLQSIRGLYAASDNVDRQGFHRFVTTVGLGPAVQALEWIPRVALSDRAEMEAVAKRDGVAGFRFTERRAQGDMVRAANREAYFPVYFVEPVAGNEAAIGFDLASSPARLAALEHTRDSGKAVATPRITLVQETGDQYGILVFMPIYQNGMPTESREERRANLAGFALGVFRIGDLVATATRKLEDTHFAVSLQIFDASAPEGSRRLYPKSAASDADTMIGSELHWSETINVAGRDWHIVVTPATGSAFAQFLWKPWAILLAGLLFTALLAQHLNSNRRRAAYIDNLVAERTAKLRKTAEGLARSNAELEQFAYVASHDLQEPLRKVQAFSDRMRSKYETVLDEQGLDYLSRMHHAAKRMQTLVNDLLSYSRVATKVEKFAPIDLDIVVQEVIADLETRIEETGAQIEVANMPTIDAVPSQMRQLFQNLIANSLKYHRNEVAPEVKITGDIIENGAIEPNGTSSKTCQITVRDNGLGFEAQYAERIFGIFQRLHGRVEFEGTGVGLAVCRKIAERHDGTIRAQGRPGEGSTFTVTLPLQHQSPEQV